MNGGLCAGVHGAEADGSNRGHDRFKFQRKLGAGGHFLEQMGIFFIDPLCDCIGVVHKDTVGFSAVESLVHIGGQLGVGRLRIGRSFDAGGIGQGCTKGIKGSSHDHFLLFFSERCFNTATRQARLYASARYSS